MDDASESMVFNGINGTTGDYATKLGSVAELSLVAQGLSIDESHLLT